MNNRNIIIDLSNYTHIFRHSLFKKNKTRYDSDFLFFNVVSGISKLTKKLNASGVMIALDSKNVWRRDIYPEYKKNRTTNRDTYYEETVKVINDVSDFFRNFTNNSVIEVSRAEADDIIAISVMNNLNEDIIISNDGDMFQLLSDKTKIFNVIKNEYKNMDDVKYRLFLKLIRGDSGDNITSAYPRVRETYIKEAYSDTSEMTNLLNTVNSRGEVVGDIIKRNNKLINLTQQPDDIKDAILNSIRDIEQNNYHFVNTRQELSNMGFKDVMGDINFEAFKMPYLFKT